MDAHSPQSVRVGIPFFRHQSEGEHNLYSWIAHSTNYFYLNMLREIEVRAIKSNRDPAKQHIANSAVPAIVEERSKPMEEFCRIYYEGANQDTLAKLENTIEENRETIHNIVTGAFSQLDKPSKKDLRKDKVRKNIINQSISIEDSDLKAVFKPFLYKKFEECYLSVVKKSIRSHSMPDLPSLPGLLTRRNSKHRRMKDEPQVVVIHSPTADRREDVFSPRPQSPDTLAYPPTPREEGKDDFNPFLSSGSEEEIYSNEISLI